jgi:GNAT superfamily N-acetyltransferase
MDNMLFKKLEGKYTTFFQILPKDWQVSLEEIFNEEEAVIYVLIENDLIVAGGILFKSYNDDMSNFKEESKLYLKANYLYIGYLFVLETYRGKHLGSKWIELVKAVYPKTKFWLTIENEVLEGFYLQNGFNKICMHNTESLFLTE